MIRGIKSGTKSMRSHLDVFREFLDHIDREAKRRAPKPKPRRKRKKTAQSA